MEKDNGQSVTICEPFSSDQRADASESVTLWQKVVQVIPQELVVTIVKHTLPFHRHLCDDAEREQTAIECWTWYSHGMWQHQQKELVVTVAALPDDDSQPPEGPLQFLHLVYQFASQGTVVDEGETTEFGSGFMGNPHIKGIVYAHAQELPGVEFYEGVPYLSAIMVLRDELEIVKLCGSTRLMSLLGYHYKYFPFPPWSERNRIVSVVNSGAPRAQFQNVNTPSPLQDEKEGDLLRKQKEKQKEKEKEKEAGEANLSSMIAAAATATNYFAEIDTMLLRVRRLRFTKGKSHAFRNNIRLRLPHSAIPLLRSIFTSIPAGKPLAILTGIDEEANSHLVWQSETFDTIERLCVPTPRGKEKGQESLTRREGKPRAIHSENSQGGGEERLGGSFVCFYPGKELDEGSIVEDGFLISLTDGSWAEVRKCLTSGQSFAMIADTPTGKNFEMKWIPDIPLEDIKDVALLNDNAEKEPNTGEDESSSPSDIPPSAETDERNLVMVREILLLTSEKQLARRVVMKELADYISLLCGVIKKVMQKAPLVIPKQSRQEQQQQQAHTVMIQVDMHQQGGGVTVSFPAPSATATTRRQDNLALLVSEESVEELRGRMQKVTPAPLKEPSPAGVSELAQPAGGCQAGVQFQIVFAIMNR